MQIPHSLMKTIENRSMRIHADAQSLAGGTLDERLINATLTEMENFAQSLLESLADAKKAMAGDDSWQRG